MKAFEISQCLTQGIRQVEILEENPKHMQTVTWESCRDGCSSDHKYLRTARLGGSIFLTYEDAQRGAQDFVDARINNLEKQIKKLRSLAFTDDDCESPCAPIRRAARFDRDRKEELSGTYTIGDKHE